MSLQVADKGEQMENVTDMAFDRPWTWKDRLRHRLYPHALPPEIPPDVPAAVLRDGDVIHTNVGIVFSWKDRLRVLFSGRVMVHCRVGATAPVDTVWSRSVAYPVWRHDGE